MGIKRIVSIALRVPLHLFLLSSLVASIYAAVKNLNGISYGTPIIFGSILLLWYIGVWMSKEKENGGPF